MTAQENAQKILDAQGAVNAAVMSAKDALMAAQQALTNAMALPAGTAGRMEAVEELEAVIKELEMEITIKDDGMHMLVAGGDLDTHSKAVEEDVEGSVTHKDYTSTYTNGKNYSTGDDRGMGTPADSAVAVAEEILTLLGGGLPTPTPDSAPDMVFAMGDTATAAMRTYNQIFTTESIALDNALVQAVPLAGTDATAEIAAAAANDAGVDYTYMGIPGLVLCRMGDDGCGTTGTTAVASGAEVGEGWYFVPSANDNGGNWRTALLSKRGGEGANSEDYVRATYAEYSAWLEPTDGTNRTPVLKWYSKAMGIPTPDTDLSADEGVQGSATYAGTAEGLSVRYSLNPVTGDRAGQQSGAFRADVRLTLDFGDENDEAMLSGVVNNFTGVHNAGVVHSGWEVTLDETLLDETDPRADSSITGVTMSKGPAALEGAGNNGRWTANPFGSHEYEYEKADGMQDKKPIAMGYHGGFGANFTNGHVVGVYAAEVEE